MLCTLNSLSLGRTPLMRIRRFLLGLTMAAALVAHAAGPAPAAPEGTLTIGVHVTLVNRWLDPGETEGLITPFMVLYPLHDALVKPMPAGPQHAEPRRVVDGVEGRAHVRLRPAEGEVPQRRPRDRRGREVLLRALPRRLREAPEGQGEGRAGRGAEPRAHRAQGAVARLHGVLRHLGHRRRLDRAQEVRREGRRRRVQEGAGGRGAVQVRVVQSRRRARARSLSRLLAQGAAA